MNRDETIGIIPRPVKVTRRPGRFHAKTPLSVFVSSSTKEVTDICTFLARTFEKLHNHKITIQTENPDDRTAGIHVRFQPHEADVADDTYRLEISEKRIIIESGTLTGLRYGLISLFQALATQVSGIDAVDISAMVIEDWPRFGWRGMHLDVSRHFFPVDDIIGFLNLLAIYKFNIFHWHLTDDQGWRIESATFPRLTEIGAWRVDDTGERYGGFYSQDDIRRVVYHAGMLGITVVPEIDIPGHTRAELAAYPELSCRGKILDVPNEWGIFDDVLCPGNEETFYFLERLFDEIIPLFPGAYVHIGGDECPTSRWENHDLCCHRMESERISRPQELQAYFIRRIRQFPSLADKRLIGWDEVIECGEIGAMTIMAWRGTDKGIAAAKKGHDVIMTPTEYCYFDYYQAVNGEPKAIGGLLPLEKVYQFNPAPAAVDAVILPHILGGQGNIWTEYMPSFDHASYMAIPRLCALAEAVWSPPENDDYRNFLSRVRRHYSLFDRLGVRYRRY